MNSPRSTTRPKRAGFTPAMFVICCLLPLPAYPQGRNQQPATPQSRLEAKADEIIHRAMRDKCIPGVALVVIKNGRVVVKKGYGVKSLESNATPDENTLFYIGSLSKAVTAFGVMRLVDQGKLTLTDQASQYVADMPSKWRSIPLRYFMAHQSGIPELRRPLPTFVAMLRGATDLPMAFEPPGSKQEYNNFNFAVAGKVIEGASKQHYLEFMRDEVFTKLGMTRTGYHQQDANSATGYILKDKTGCQRETIENVAPRGGPYGIPSGFLQTTLADLLKLYRAIEQQRLLTPASYQAMFSRVTPQLSGTPGWFAREVGGVKIIAKNGSAQGFASDFQFAPERRDAVIILLNIQRAQTSSITNELLREVCGLPLPGNGAVDDR